MKQISKDELKEILEKHRLWIDDECDGERANLSEVDLSRADLSGADLSGADLSGTDLSKADLSRTDLSIANLSGADLSKVNLSGANLSGVILSGANLSMADLSRADLSRANLWGANLSKANLSEANLRGANLREANLRGTNLSKANLSEANLRGAKNIPFVPYACPDVGSFIGYKKAGYYIIELEILSDARRCSATGRKCRCDKAKVLSIQHIDGTMAGIESVSSDYDHNFIYKVGEVVEEPNFNDDRWNECSKGIHFFINRREAVNYIK